MIKLVALYRKPADMNAFNTHYQNIHIPLVENYPGMREMHITHITGAPIGDTKFCQMTEMHFDSKDAMDAALASPEGRAVAKDLMGFAADLVTVFFGEVKS